MKVHKISLIKAIYNHYRNAMLGNALSWNNIPKHVQKRSVRKKLAKINEVLENGLDIGGIVESVIPVTLVDDADYGLCFYSEERNELFIIWDYS